MADPQFHVLTGIDLLLSSSVTLSLLFVGQIKLENMYTTLILQKTKLGSVTTTDNLRSFGKGTCYLTNLKNLLE